jgi:hypothetical protein
MIHGQFGLIFLTFVASQKHLGMTTYEMIKELTERTTALGRYL